ncbi:MOSC N-terminal beta barrel domain-containing protein [Streptomyces sp. ACA25]|uniref:MOSC domain-containing protein n=1 Tax=Streptomyces sp. ACA25 TaxID=3022596 RepID=UPI002307D452|nr:MOSC N-terminal beta barrel domain-containing protein [Streptomyces sp. ACA25]MDB1088097.1 MOSC N-terminal beta barrel domain-containing protein [Streptomyces sp. ACA25]
MAAIAELTYYPVKGCAGTAVRDAVLTPAGLAHDRSFMVVGENGVFRSQRQDPLMARIRPEVSADGEQLTLAAPGTGAVTLQVDTSAPRREVELFKKQYRGVDQGEQAAAWLSDVLGAPSRLMRVPPEHERVSGGLTPGTVGYADSCAVLVASLASLAGLNERIAEGGSGPLPVDRFRPNIVVSGWAEPHTEDRVRRMTIGDTELGYSKIAIRCAVTTIDQRSGTRSGPEPLRTLAGYRRAAAGGVAFGAKFAVTRTGKLSVGDEITVTAWGDSGL